ncbi:MAG: hypothetical protein HY005_01940 [Candidatus Staskawiczbacteria bacterium]|nr:hypothetical protein [Candidatus Staskawiczbacteria bacterium]
MSNTFTNKIQRGKRIFDDIRAQFIVRVWGLAKRLDPKTMVKEKKKKGFSKTGNKGK